MGTLYIIGNGFDLHFDLKTKTEHFAKYLKAQPVYNEVCNALDVLNCYGVDWHEYEQALNDIDLDEIMFLNQMQPDYLSERESDRDGGIVNMQMYVDSLNNAIVSALKEMVIAANNDAKALSMRSPGKRLFKVGDAVLSFNYTSTVEYLFDIPNNMPIFHIHGCQEDNEPLIFGYRINDNSYADSWNSADEESWDFYISQQREVVYAFYEGWRKKLQLDELNAFLKKCCGIDRVVVLGHSMSAVDADYMELVEKYLRPEEWHISYYKDDEMRTIASQMYTFLGKTKFAKINELMK